MLVRYWSTLPLSKLMLLMWNCSLVHEVHKSGSCLMESLWSTALWITYASNVPFC